VGYVPTQVYEQMAVVAAQGRASLQLHTELEDAEKRLVDVKAAFEFTRRADWKHIWRLVMAERRREEEETGEEKGEEKGKEKGEEKRDGEEQKDDVLTGRKGKETMRGRENGVARTDGVDRSDSLDRKMEESKYEAENTVKPQRTAGQSAQDSVTKTLTRAEKRAAAAKKRLLAELPENVISVLTEMKDRVLNISVDDILREMGKGTKGKGAESGGANVNENGKNPFPGYPGIKDPTILTSIIQKELDEMGHDLFILQKQIGNLKPQESRANIAKDDAYDILGEDIRAEMLAEDLARIGNESLQDGDGNAFSITDGDAFGEGADAEGGQSLRSGKKGAYNHAQDSNVR
jgi:hypothetical protein